METNKKQSQGSDFAKASSDEQAMDNNELLLEILENTRATKKHLKWQLYITIVLVVLPLLAMVFIIPMVLRSIGNVYGSVIQ